MERLRCFTLPTEMQAAHNQGLSWDLAPLPGTTGPVGKMLTIAVGIPSASRHQDERVLKYYMSAEVGALQNKADIMPSRGYVIKTAATTLPMSSRSI